MYKVALLGEGSVGKTSLVRRFVHNKFDDKYMRTLGANIYKRDIVVKEGKKMYDVHLQIWDVLGQDAYTTVINSALKNVKGVIFVTDLTKRKSLLNLKKWIDRVYRNVGSASFIFIGNKTDIGDRAFGLSELERYSEAYNGVSLLTSAKSGANVEICFQHIADRLIAKKIAPPRDQIKLPHFTHKVSPWVQTADQMIDEFCMELGGYERAMPVTRTVFKNSKCDFEKLNSDDLDSILESLTDIIMDEKGPDIADEFRDKMKAMISEQIEA